MCFNQRGDISTLNSSSLKLVDKFTNLESSVSSTKTDINMRQAKACTAIDRLSVIKIRLDRQNEMQFLPSSMCWYCCMDGNYTRMLWALLNKSWRQHTTKQQLYGYQPSITKTSKIGWTRHVGHSWRSRDELISDVLLWTPLQGRTNLQGQHCADTGCSLNDLLEAMDDREGWQERVRDICADSMTWCWWWWCQNFECRFSRKHIIHTWKIDPNHFLAFILQIYFHVLHN